MFFLPGELRGVSFTEVKFLKWSELRWKFRLLLCDMWPPKAQFEVIKSLLSSKQDANHSGINHNNRAVKLVISDTATLTDVLIPNT